MSTTTNSTIKTYLIYCKTQKRLSEKTLKAYRIDLEQFSSFLDNPFVSTITASDIESYITHLNQLFKPKTSKRKVASLKALFRFLEYKNIIVNNPFQKIQVKFREPLLLPQIIPLYTLEAFLAAIYKENSLAQSLYRKKRTLLDIAIAETLFSTGMRVSELCNLKSSDIDLHDATIRIYGKGSKERMIHIGNEDVLQLLKRYKNEFSMEIERSGYFFTNTNFLPISDQAVRRMINKYCNIAAINLHITPHMFRHTFATCLLEADVDIRYIQQMLGHSSITVTEIYTHVTLSKQKNILTTKHPRKNFKFQ